jgi:hypothetical protein
MSCGATITDGKPLAAAGSGADGLRKRGALPIWALPVCYLSRRDIVDRCRVAAATESS